VSVVVSAPPLVTALLVIAQAGWEANPRLVQSDPARGAMEGTATLERIAILSWK
jgi:hypothetical protein